MIPSRRKTKTAAVAVAAARLLRRGNWAARTPKDQGPRISGGPCARLPRPRQEVGFEMVDFGYAGTMGMFNCALPA